MVSAVGVSDLEDAHEVHEAFERPGIVAAPGRDLLEPVSDGVRVDVHLFGRFGDVEVGVGEGADGVHGDRTVCFWEGQQIVALGGDDCFRGAARTDQGTLE